MKKIRNHKELKAELDRLAERRQTLELEIRDQWSGMKQGLKPSNTAATLVDTFFRKEPKTVKGTLLRSAVTFGVGLLVEKAGSGWLQMLRRKRQPA